MKSFTQGDNLAQFSSGSRISMPFRNAVFLGQALALLLLAAVSLPIFALQSPAQGRAPKSPNALTLPSINVAVTNTPSVQVSGTASVAVANNDSTPVITRRAKEPEPFMLASQNSVTPLQVLLPSRTADGAQVKTVVIEFFTSDCGADPGTTLLGSARLFVTFTGSVVSFAFPTGPPMAFSNTAEFVNAQQTLMFADPGTLVDYGFSGGGAKCQLVLSGHLIPL